MINLNKFIELFISLQIIIISTFVPIYITLPFTNGMIQTLEMPITWQIPSIIIITMIFKGKIVIKAFSIYLIIGLFFIPVFHQGGSLGYLLTPNFGYLLGLYPLIKIFDNLIKIKQKIIFYDLLKYGISGILSMHLIGITYSCFQILYFKQADTLLYYISKYSLGNIGYHILILTPITLLIKFINNKKYQRNV